ncbi:MAG: hypothetical protein JNL21_22125 [Myxococcales bacterium]|nr:hypothetical protein [Myxococcales bacterium]
MLALRLVLAIAALLVARSASASLSTDAERAREALVERGAAAVTRKTVFLEESHPIVVSGAGEGERGCGVVVLLAARSVAFTATLPPKQAAGLRRLPSEEASAALKRESNGGLLVLSSCEGPVEAVVSLGSARGALEILTAALPAELTDLSTQLDRELGPVAPRGDPGPPISPDALALRRRRAESRAREEGATNVLPLDMRAGPLGTGELRMRMPAGCHRLDVMAEVSVSSSGAVPPTDVDVELRDAVSGEVIARDRGETPDARVEACVAKVTDLSLQFRGAPADARVLVTDAIWPLPSWVPSRWGAAAQAALAAAVRRRAGAVQARGPVAESLGAQGSTQVAVSLEPDRCYIASIALMKGSSRGLRLSAIASSRPSTEELPPGGGSPSVLFCADGAELARLVVDVPGASVWWVLAVWQLGAAGLASEAGGEGAP